MEIRKEEGHATKNEKMEGMYSVRNGNGNFRGQGSGRDNTHGLQHLSGLLWFGARLL